MCYPFSIFSCLTVFHQCINYSVNSNEEKNIYKMPNLKKLLQSYIIKILFEKSYKSHVFNPYKSNGSSLPSYELPALPPPPLELMTELGISNEWS